MKNEKPAHHRAVFKNIRLTEAEARQIRAKAEAAGVTTSDWIRAAALGQHIKSRVDMTALNELRRQGGLVKHLYNEGADPAATASALAALEQVAARLMRG